MSIDTEPTLTPEEQERLTGLLDEALQRSSCTTLALASISRPSCRECSTP